MVIIKCLRMSLQPLPLRIIIRQTSMKYVTGLARAMARAQAGILSTGVKSPLIKMKIIMKKNVMNMTCCWVSQEVAMSRPRPSMAMR